MPLALRINAATYLVAAVALLAATWKSLYEELDSFRPVPWIYAQLAGAALFGLGYLCWQAAKRGGDMAVQVARACAIVNVIGFGCISIWLFSDDKGIPSSGTLGSWVFDIFAVLILVLGILEARAYLRES
jgi:cytochrome bd-type quinol oxidase subunit 2